MCRRSISARLAFATYNWGERERVPPWEFNAPAVCQSVSLSVYIYIYIYIYIYHTSVRMLEHYGASVSEVADNTEARSQ